MTLSIMTFSITTLIRTLDTTMSVIKLSVIMLSVKHKPFMICVVMLSVVMLSVVMLSVVMLSVVAPMKGPLVINKSHLEGGKKLSLCLIATNYYLIVTSEASPACLPMPLTALSCPPRIIP
jgi:hypothetical protein